MNINNFLNLIINKLNKMKKHKNEYKKHYYTILLESTTK